MTAEEDRAARRGEIPTIKFGRKYCVPAEKWIQMLNGEILAPGLTQP